MLEFFFYLVKWAIENWIVLIAFMLAVPLVFLAVIHLMYKSNK